MKPVGLRDPRTGQRPWAVVQLRQDNALGTLWNIVGFQTKLKHGEQVAPVPHHPRPAERRVRAAGRPAPQHLPQQPAPARRHAAAEGAAATCASPARSPAARAMSRAPPSACWPAGSRPPSCRGETPSAAARHDGDGRAARPHHRRRRRRDLPADERQLRPVPADRGHFPRQGAQAGAGRPRARDFDRWLPEPPRGLRRASGPLA